MRYLFGDSTPFPLSFDFLATLDAFVGCAGIVVRLEAETRVQEKRVREEAETRTRLVDNVDRFHRTVLKAMRDTASRTVEREVIDYANDLTEHATQYVDMKRISAANATERDVAQLKMDQGRRREDARAALKAFFAAATLPVLDSAWSMKLEGVGREAVHEISVVETHADGIVCSLVLDANAVNEWRVPRKVSDFVPGLELMVGAKRSWFNKSVQRDLLKLDEFILSGFELDDDHAEIRLRRRLEQREDSLVFVLRRIDAELFAEVRHPDDHEVDQMLSAQVEPHDRPHLERFWQVLRRSVAPMAAFRSRMTALQLDGSDVFESDAAGEVVDRLVDILALTAQEVARRSPNINELSLKEEGTDGRRREIYLRKDDLVRKLEPLTPEDRSRFVPLALFGDGEALSRSVPMSMPPIPPSSSALPGGVAPTAGPGSAAPAASVASTRSAAPPPVSSVPGSVAPGSTATDVREVVDSMPLIEPE